MKKIFLILSLSFLLLISSRADAAAPPITLEINPKSATIGSTIQYKVSVGVNNNGSRVRNIELFIDGQQADAYSCGSTYTCIHSFSKVANKAGQIPVFTKVFYLDGNIVKDAQSDTQMLNIVVDTNLSVSLAINPGGSIILNSTVQYTVSASVSTNILLGYKIRTIALFIDGKQVDSYDCGSVDSCTHSFSEIANKASQIPVFTKVSYWNGSIVKTVQSDSQTLNVVTVDLSTRIDPATKSAAVGSTAQYEVLSNYAVVTNDFIFTIGNPSIAWPTYNDNPSNPKGQIKCISNGVTTINAANFNGGSATPASITCGSGTTGGTNPGGTNPSGNTSGGTTVGGGGFTIQNPLKANDFKELVDYLIKFAFYVALAAAPLMVIIAGFFWITAAGDTKRLQTAQNIILYTSIGLAVILLARGLVAIIKSVLGG